MLKPKTIFATFGINKQRYRDNFELEGEIQKYLRIFSYQVLSLTDYFYDFINTYRFFPIGVSYKGITKNFPDYSLVEDGADQQALFRLAKSFNIGSVEVNEVLFEWESKFIEKITEVGIDKYIKTYFKYHMLNILEIKNDAELISQLIKTEVFEWHNNEISEYSSNVYTNEKNDLTVYLEIVLPKRYSYLISSAVSKIKEIFYKLNRLLAVGIKIKFIEFIWR